MRIDVLTLFTEMCRAVTSESMIGRAQKDDIIDIKFHDIRNYANNKHKRVDDTPYGGGKGMIMMAEPIALCFEKVCSEIGKIPKLVYMSPQGKTLTQQMGKDLSKLDNLVILCGHYEGIDERIINQFVDQEISIGDYVLTGGELPALVLIDMVSRLVPGVLSSNECFQNDSHYSGILEHPQYTKPQVWRGQTVPKVLLSGHHANIKEWKDNQSMLNTIKKRPDIIQKLDGKECY